MIAIGSSDILRWLAALATFFCAAAGPGQEASIKSITQAVKITWDSEFGNGYSLLRSSSPAGPWEPVRSLVPGTGGEISVYDDIQRIAGRFYTLEVADITPPGMVPIAGGTYEMGDHFCVDELYLGWAGDCSRPVHAVRVDSFYMDMTEVTNADFCAFLNAAKRAGQVQALGERGVYSAGERVLFYSELRTASYCVPGILYDESSDTFRTVENREQHPAIEVSWHGAAAYCNWRSEQQGLKPCYDPDTWECDFEADGYRLPTEAEWEYAARGGLRYSIYPWGDEIDGSKANYFGSGDPHEDEWITRIGAGTTPVAFYSPNAYGLYDMAGNAMEWCNDWFGRNYYEYCVENGIISNPTGPSEPIYHAQHQQRSSRGGSCVDDPHALSCSARRYSEEGFSRMGFRTVRRPPSQ